MFERRVLIWINHAVSSRLININFTVIVSDTNASYFDLVVSSASNFIIPIVEQVSNSPSEKRILV